MELLIEVAVIGAWIWAISFFSDRERRTLAQISQMWRDLEAERSDADLTEEERQQALIQLEKKFERAKGQL